MIFDDEPGRDYQIRKILHQWGDPVGQKHKWACERFLNDLNRVGDPDFPYIWDEERADKIVKWFALLLTVKESCQDSRSG